MTFRETPTPNRYAKPPNQKTRKRNTPFQLCEWLLSQKDLLLFPSKKFLPRIIRLDDVFNQLFLCEVGFFRFVAISININMIVLHSSFNPPLNHLCDRICVNLNIHRVDKRSETSRYDRCWPLSSHVPRQHFLYEF